MLGEIKTEDQMTCDKCGRFGARAFGETNICEDCYGTACSCCPEFGREKESNED